MSGDLVCLGRMGLELVPLVSVWWSVFWWAPVPPVGPCSGGSLCWWASVLAGPCVGALGTGGSGVGGPHVGALGVGESCVGALGSVVSYRSLWSGAHSSFARPTSQGHRRGPVLRGAGCVTIKRSAYRMSTPDPCNSLPKGHLDAHDASPSATAAAVSALSRRRFLQAAAVGTAAATSVALPLETAVAAPARTGSLSFTAATNGRHRTGGRRRSGWRWGDGCGATPAARWRAEAGGRLGVGAGARGWGPCPGVGAGAQGRGRCPTPPPGRSGPGCAGLPPQGRAVQAAELLARGPARTGPAGAGT
ncbi:twin-arginine translocation signal domain-containing protein [Streptomyces hygroscopicus]|uniref:twin-arginine translocation signal domain-containing protein n=1 Tax=Streptomyces hygroscopicus TaxID=1912 RepID=UPI003D7C3271